MQLNCAVDFSFEAVHGSPFRVLVVEDNPLIQSLHKEMLRSLNCKVDVASNGKEALALSHHVYDLILLDMELPDFSGTEIAAQLRAQKIHKKTRIIAITTLAREAIKARCLAVGIQQVINKPIDIKEMKALLR